MSITRTSDLAGNGLALVLGAGQCADIPLDRLAERFAEVRLLDEDPSAVAGGIASFQLQATHRAKVNIVIGDLTGIVSPLVRAIREEFQRHAPPKSRDGEQWIDSLARVAEQVEPSGETDFGSPDFVVASCVLSQLHVTAVQTALAEIERQTRCTGLPRLAADLRQAPRWTEAMLSLARRMEDRFIDELAIPLARGAVAYVADTVQMCFVRLLPDGDWSTDGLYRMARSERLADYFDNRFAVAPLGQWAWVVGAPAVPADLGRVYRVQALEVRENRS